MSAFLGGDVAELAPWEIPLACPFCGEVCVLVRDHSLIPDDMPDDEREAITCGESGFYDCDDGLRAPGALERLGVRGL